MLGISRLTTVLSSSMQQVITILYSFFVDENGFYLVDENSNFIIGDAVEGQD